MEYIIGAGAVLESGENGTITAANLHARLAYPPANQIHAAAIDFESTSPAALTRLLIAVHGLNNAGFRDTVSDRLRRQRTCTLADVLSALARGARTSEVHLFAHWLPEDETCAALARQGITVIAHPLEAIEAASVVTGQRNRRWRAA